MERILFRLSYPASLLILFLFHLPVIAQRSVRDFFQFNDSVECESSSYFLYSSITWEVDQFSEKLTRINIETPANWRLMGSSELEIKQSSRKKTIIPLTFVRTRYTPSSWSRVGVCIMDSVGCPLLDTFFLIKAPAISDFQILPASENFELNDSSRYTTIAVRLKNLGTINSYYNISGKVLSEIIFERRTPPLFPGVDTVLKFPIQLASLPKADQYRVQIQVADSAGLIRALPVEIYRRFSMKKIHTSPFKQLPLSIDWGAFWVDKRLYHFAEVQSTVLLNSGFAKILYRTKTFGQFKTVEKNIVQIDLEKKHFSLSLGQQSEVAQFFAYGNGIRFLYRPDSALEIGVKGIFHQPSSGYSNNNFQFFIHHGFRAFRFIHQLQYDADRRKGIFGYLLLNQFKWTKQGQWVVNFSIGTGVEEFRRIRVLHSGELGWSMGGLLNYYGKGWQLNGEFRYVQKSFPGLLKGYRLHQYEAVRELKSARFALFYQYSYNTNPLFIDTVYLADAFSYNVEKMGFKVLVTGVSKEFNFSFGGLRQSGLMGSQVPQYLFGENYFTWRKNANFTFQFSALTGYASNHRINKSVWLNNTTADFKFKRVGVKGFYVQYPFLKDSITKIFMHYNRTYLISPYATIRFFNKLRTVWRYSFSRSLFDKRTIQSIGISMIYKNGRGDWQFQCTATMPLSSTMSNKVVTASYPFVMLSIRKEFKLPLIFKRQYHNLLVHAFEDLNANNQLDQGEKKIPSLRFKVNQSNFETDPTGRFQLLNADTGTYSITMQPGLTTKGLIPATVSTTIHLVKSTSVQIPIRRGYAIRGVVKLETDPYSTKKYTLENILVIITSEKGERFSTITDSLGQFYKPLPAGRYSVSLNKDAFTGALQPVQTSFDVDLMSESFEGVYFVLRERKREIRYRAN